MKTDVLSTSLNNNGNPANHRFIRLLCDFHGICSLLWRYNMRILDNIKEVLDEIEQKDQRSFEFVEKIIIQKEEQPEKKLTKLQFKWLNDLHDRYC